METKVSDVLSTSIMHNLGFYHLISVPPMGTKGGILCAWRTSLSPNVISTSSNMINLLFYPLDYDK